MIFFLLIAHSAAYSPPPPPKKIFLNSIFPNNILRLIRFVVHQISIFLLGFGFGC